MKKISLLLFTLYFFLVSTGVVLGSHSCGKRVSYSAWGISFTDASACKCNHKEALAEHKKNCCKKDTKWIKSSLSDSKGQQVIVLCKSSCTPLNHAVVNPFYLPLNKMHYSPKIVHSPPIPDFQLFLKNRSLLI